mmetsp:Transcript_30916/g.65827  ORF Transcript_30916/g.65827 Transcript_30916/m.65827 type:complete len:112 (+) Transcript_30916:161-496(+)
MVWMAQEGFVNTNKEGQVLTRPKLKLMKRELISISRTTVSWDVVGSSWLRDSCIECIFPYKELVWFGSSTSGQHSRKSDRNPTISTIHRTDSQSCIRVIHRGRAHLSSCRI